MLKHGNSNYDDQTLADNPRTYPMKFGYKLLQIAPSLISTAGSRPDFTDDIRKHVDIKELFYEMPWGDLWDDAGMRDVVKYLRGNTNLKIPCEWRAFLPTELPDRE